MKEKSMEALASKRRRVAESRTSRRPANDSDDDEDEFMLDDVHDQASLEKDALSGLSKESREVLTRIGLGNTIRKDEEAVVLAEPVKVRVPYALLPTVTRSNICRSTLPRERILSCLSSLESCGGRLFRHRCPRRSQAMKVQRSRP